MKLAGLGIVALMLLDYSNSQGAATDGSRPARPNVLFLIADDLGYADLGVQGCRDIPTPHLDSIAKNGIRFTSGYVRAGMQPQSGGI